MGWGGGGGSLGKGGRCVGLTTLPPPCVECLEIWLPEPPGAVTACSGLQKYCVTFTSHPFHEWSKCVPWAQRATVSLEMHLKWSEALLDICWSQMYCIFIYKRAIRIYYCYYYTCDYKPALRICHCYVPGFILIWQIILSWTDILPGFRTHCLEKIPSWEANSFLAIR
jgi:hypothetical protein